MLHHKVTKLDLEKLDELSLTDLEQYLADIKTRITHLEHLSTEARELAAAIERRIRNHREASSS
jgi:hypothetical protein